MGGTDEGSRSSGAARSSPSHPLLRVVKSPPLRRLLLAYLVFNTTEWATWIAILVWAFDSGGASAAGLIAVFQLVPATLVAPFAASMGDRMRRDRALSLGYAIQAASMLTRGGLPDRWRPDADGVHHGCGGGDVDRPHPPGAQRDRARDR